MHPSYKVFVSSTYMDNVRRRDLVEGVISRLGMVPVGMGRFGAQDQPPLQVCLQELATCDLYLGILGLRYGSYASKDGLSYTELEYQAAAGKPRFLFVIDPRLPHTNEELDPAPERWEKQAKLDAFKKRLTKDGITPAFFREETLGLEVLDSLRKWLEKQGVAPPRQVEEEFQRYLDQAAALYAEVPLLGFDTRLKVPIVVDDLYVPLDAVVDRSALREGKVRTSGEAGERFGAQEQISLMQAFPRAAQLGGRRAVLILGDPGSGKTTHLKRLLLHVRQRGAVPLGLAEGTIPVFLPLRDLRAGDEDFAGFAQRSLEHADLKTRAGFGGLLLERGKLLFLIDGLDEVADPERRAAVAGWIDEAIRRCRDCYFALTCRYAGFDPKQHGSARFLELHLRPLTPEQSAEVVCNWYRAVETKLADDKVKAEEVAKAKAAELIARLRSPEIRGAARVYELTVNPLLLTAICLVNLDRGHLPEKRVALYQECIEVLLERWRKLAKKLPVTVSAAQARLPLQAVASWLHGVEGRRWAQEGEIVPVLAPVLETIKLANRDAGQFLRTVEEESGLLVGWGDDSYGFLHLGFQEYLAARQIRARALAEKPQQGALERLAAHFGESWWQEVTLLFLALEEEPSLFEEFLAAVLKQHPEPSAEQRSLLEACFAEAYQISIGPAAQRARRLLGVRAEEERPEPTLLTPKGGIELVRIPAGRFLMGEGKERHPVELSEFLLGRYPVTNAQYGQYLKENRGAKEPEYWGDRRFNAPDKPVVGVSWQEALDFCRWAGGTLPTEAQWEYACRAGTTSRFFWGDGEKDAGEYAWYAENSTGRLQAVGLKKPNLWGLYDMAGNVWEWCQDWYGTYPTGSVKDPRGPASAADRVIRGGSSWDDAWWLRSANRSGVEPRLRLFLLGFRVCLPAAPGVVGD